MRADAADEPLLGVLQAIHHGDAPEAARLLLLGAEVNLEVWVDSGHGARHRAALSSNATAEVDGEDAGKMRDGSGPTRGRGGSDGMIGLAAASGGDSGVGGQSGGDVELKWRVADESMWGRTALDRLVKFGGLGWGGREGDRQVCRFVAEAVCAFVKGGTRVEERETRREASKAQWLDAASSILVSPPAMCVLSISHAFPQHSWRLPDHPLLHR